MLGLLVVVYKIPYSSCSYVNQVRCNWCVPMLLLSSCGIVYSRVQKTPASEKKEDVRISHQTENQKEILVYVPGTYISPFVVALAAGVNSNPSSREKFVRKVTNHRWGEKLCVTKTKLFNATAF